MTHDMPEGTEVPNSEVEGPVGGSSEKRSWLRSIRRYCVECAGSPYQVSECGGEWVFNANPPGPCALYPWRFGVRPETAQGTGRDLRGKRRTPGTAIHAECRFCCCGSFREVVLCPATRCALWQWRFGCRPETAKRRGHIAAPEEFLLVRTEPEEPGGPEVDRVVLPDGRKVTIETGAWRNMQAVRGELGKLAAENESPRE